MKELIEKALKEVKDAINNVEARYWGEWADWETDDLSLIVSLEAAKRELDAALEAARE